MLLARACARLRPSRTARARGRAAGSGHPRLRRQRPHHDGTAHARWPQPASACTGWGLGWNLGVQRRHARPAGSRRRGVSATGEPVMLVGWSLGGVYRARAGPPAARTWCARWSRWARLSPATRTRTMSGGSTNGSPATRSTSRRSRGITDKPPVPTLAIWSRKDGIVAPRAARGLDGERDAGGRARLRPHGVRRVATITTRQVVREIDSFLKKPG